jgi:hypothetical protein
MTGEVTEQAHGPHEERREDAPEHEHEHHDRASAVAAVAEAPSAHAAFSKALGGPVGMIESALPAVAFVTAYTVSGQETMLAALIAGGFGVLTSIIRLLRRETVQYALSGLAGLGLAIFVVSRTGKAEDFFLPGLLLNMAYAGAAIVSVLVRWPLLGVLVGLVTQQGTKWRKNPRLMRTYSRATWMWAGLFSLRLLVQLPLYLAGAVVALGVARVAMGLPLFAVGIWLSWLIIRERPLTPASPASPA